MARTVPDVAHAVGAPVALEDAPDLGPQVFALGGTIRPPCRSGPLRQMFVAGGRGDRQHRLPARRMSGLGVENQANGPPAHLRGKLVRGPAQEAPSCSRVGASGKLGSVQCTSGHTTCVRSNRSVRECEPHGSHPPAPPPCPIRASTCRSFETISSGLSRFVAIPILRLPEHQGRPLRWGRIRSLDPRDRLRLARVERLSPSGSAARAAGWGRWSRRRRCVSSRTNTPRSRRCLPWRARSCGSVPAPATGAR